jgi:hypothetical protein
MPQSSDVSTLAGVARALQARGVRAPAGRTSWQPVQVSRLLAAIGQAPPGEDPTYKFLDFGMALPYVRWNEHGSYRAQEVTDCQR